MSLTVQFDAPFMWTPKRMRVARSLAETGLPVATIAQRTGVSERAIYEWKKHPEFQARVDRMLEEYTKEAQQKSIAAIGRRLDSYARDWQATETILEERGAQLSEEVDVKKDPYAGGASMP